MFTQIELQVADAIELYKGLEAVKKHKGARFAVLVAKNAKELEKALRKYEDMAKPSEEFLKVSAEAHKLAEAEDAEGIEKLESENVELIEERKLQIKALDEEMKKTAEFSLQTIREDQLPEEISPEEVIPLLPILV